EREGRRRRLGLQARRDRLGTSGGPRHARRRAFEDTAAGTGARAPARAGKSATRTRPVVIRRPRSRRPALISGVTVEVRDRTTGSVIGNGSTPNDWGIDWDPVLTSPLNAGHMVDARQFACTGVPPSPYSAASEVFHTRKSSVNSPGAIGHRWNFEKRCE